MAFPGASSFLVAEADVVSESRIGFNIDSTNFFTSGASWEGSVWLLSFAVVACDVVASCFV